MNLSEDFLHDPGLLPAIERELTTTGIDPSHLILEVTEQIALADPEGARALVKSLCRAAQRRARTASRSMEPATLRTCT